MLFHSRRNRCRRRRLSLAGADFALIAQDGLGLEQVDHGVDVYGVAGLLNDRTAVGAEEGVRIVAVRRGEKRGPGHRHDGPIVIVQRFEILAAMNAVGPKLDHAIAIQPVNPVRVLLAHRGHRSHRAAAGSLEMLDAAIDDAFRSHGDVSVQYDHGVGRFARSRLIPTDGMANGRIDASRVRRQFRRPRHHEDARFDAQSGGWLGVGGQNDVAQSPAGQRMADGVADHRPAQQGQHALVRQALAARPGEDDADRFHTSLIG